MDVAAASTISNDVTIFFGNGDGTLQLAGQILIDGGDPSVILARDVNDDGQNLRRHPASSYCRNDWLLEHWIATTSKVVAILNG